MISIIIPVYNADQYIYAAIDSCLRQDFQDFEILVINDGSTDSLSEEKLRKYNSKIKYFFQKNSGAGYARNLGLKYAKGEYVFFLDADDELEEGALSSLHTNIKECDFIIAKATRVFIDKDEKIYKEEIWKEQVYKKSLNKYSLVVDTISTNKLYRYNFLLKNRLRFELGGHEDILFIVKLFDITHNFTFLNKCIYRWNVRDSINTRSSVLNIETLEERVKVLQVAIDYTEDEKLKVALVDNAITHDLMRYINFTNTYNEIDQNALYLVYIEFIKRYNSYISVDMIVDNSKEKTIASFVEISKRYFNGKFGIKKLISHSMYTKIHTLNLFFKNLIKEEDK